MRANHRVGVEDFSPAGRISGRAVAVPPRRMTIGQGPDDRSFGADRRRAGMSELCTPSGLGCEMLGGWQGAQGRIPCLNGKGSVSRAAGHGTAKPLMSFHAKPLRDTSVQHPTCSTRRQTSEEPWRKSPSQRSLFSGSNGESRVRGDGAHLRAMTAFGATSVEYSGVPLRYRAHSKRSLCDAVAGMWNGSSWVLPPVRRLT